MFIQNSLSRQSPISLFPPFCKRMILRFLEWGLAVFVKFSQALIASICQDTDVLCNLSLVILEELKVMFTSISKGSCHNFGGLLVGNQLRFLSVTLLFATVIPFWAFFGRSICCSLTSTSTTSKIVSLGWSAFLPGRRNLPERTRAFSTFWIVRQTVVLLMP